MVTRTVHTRSWIRNLGLALLLMTCAPWSLAQSQTSPLAPYTYTLLDLPLTSPRTQPNAYMLPTGISNLGFIAAQPENNGQVGSLLSFSVFRPTTIQCEPGFLTRIRGMNNVHDLAGNCTTSQGYRGFVRRWWGQFQWIEYPGALFTEVEHVNDRGDVVGWYMKDGETLCPNELDFYGFRLKDGHYERLYGPSCRDILFPRSSNRDGTVVGFVYAGFVNWNYTQRGFVLAPGQFQFLTVINKTQAESINNEGQVLLEEGGRTYLWEAGTLTQLPPIPQFPAAEIHGTALNDLGQVVGWYWQGGVINGFLATPARRVGRR